MFQTFAENTSGPFIVGQDPELANLHNAGILFGAENAPDHEQKNSSEPDRSFIAESLVLDPMSSSFKLQGIDFTIPVPGLFNVLNASAAVAICAQTGLTLKEMVPALSSFTGVARRFQSAGIAHGIEVIDDFAHNPDKISAALAAARSRLEPQSGRPGRILAFFQPHGFGPTRFLRQALTETFIQELGQDDILWMPEIFFAGGTVQKDISAADLIADICQGGKDARFIADRPDIAPAIAAAAKKGDLIIIMGARDPSLTSFCGEILQNLENRVSE